MDALWDELISIYSKFEIQRLHVLSHPYTTAMLEEALLRASSNAAALDFIRFIPDHEKQKLLPVLMQLACDAIREQSQASLAVRSLPRRWTAENIEAPAREMLITATELEFGMLLKLLNEIKPELAHTIALEYLDHENEDLRQMAKAFIEDPKEES